MGLGYNLFLLVICKRSNLPVHLHKSYFEQTKDFIMLKKLSVIALATVALAASATSFAKESLLDRINQKVRLPWVQKGLTLLLPTTMKAAN